MTPAAPLLQHCPILRQVCLQQIQDVTNVNHVAELLPALSAVQRLRLKDGSTDCLLPPLAQLSCQQRHLPQQLRRLQESSFPPALPHSPYCLCSWATSRR